MSNTVNKVILIGHVGKAPAVKLFEDGNKIAQFSIATTENWKDKKTNEWQSKTYWHRISVKKPYLVEKTEKYLHKGSLVYIEGQHQERSYEDKEGKIVYISEIVVNASGNLIVLDKKDNEEKRETHTSSQEAPPNNAVYTVYDNQDIDDSIPF